MHFYDGGTPPGWLSLRRIHWWFASFVIFALVSGFLTFNWSWRIPFPLREWVFAAHRIAGLCGGVCGVFWLVRFRFPQRRKQTPDRTHIAIRVFQFVLVLLLLSIVSTAWIGRSLGGRWLELISPLPVFNLVSRPDSALAHELLTVHGMLAKIMLAALLVHATSAGLHWLWDGRFRRTGSK